MRRGWRLHEICCQCALLACTDLVLDDGSRQSNAFIDIKKAMSGQVRLRGGRRRLPDPTRCSSPELRRFVWIGHTRIRRVESVIQTIARLAALCHYSNFFEKNSSHQLLIWQQLVHTPILRASSNCWVARTLPTLPFVLERCGFFHIKCNALSKASSNFSMSEE